jgi:hypothetical protein
VEWTSTTTKLDVSGVDVYLVLSSRVGRPHVEVRVDHCPRGNAEEAERGYLAVACDMANALLLSGTWDLAALVDCWRYVSGSPAGACPQLRCMVRSPLDAAARWIQSRLDDAGCEPGRGEP